ncbi:MAG: alpha/beta hydrolase [Cryomorphaceae bacterium]|nr:alpha/beta hydrolase [Cryomorphaceae bacterium]
MMMRNLFIGSLCLLVTTIWAQQPTGSWKGVLDAGMQKLNINLHIKSLPDNKFSGTFDSPDQHAFDIPLSSVGLENGQIVITETSGNIRMVLDFKGEDSLSGTFTQGNQSFPIWFARASAEQIEAERRRPQDPEKPYPYVQEDLSFVNANGDTIFGTLTYPEGRGKFPGVVLVTGSGPQNRNSEILGHRPFLVLSDYLTRKGIAVFRYDERGVGESGGDFDEATTLDFAEDASLALITMANHKKVHNKRVGIFGHSEGGLIAPIVNQKHQSPNFMILAATPAIPMDQLLLTQQALVLESQGYSQTQIEEHTGKFRDIFQLIQSSPDLETAEKKVQSFFQSEIDQIDDPNTQRAMMAEVNSIKSSMLNPWFIFFIKYNPLESLQSIEVPTLVINGKRDLQVPSSENIPAMKKAFSSGKNPPVEYKVYENLNHLFQTTETGAPDEYGSIDETFNEAVMEDIANFIISQRKGKKVK